MVIFARHVSSVTRPPKFPFFGNGSHESKSVGVIAPAYGLERVSYLLDVDGYDYATLTTIPLHRLERRGTFFNNTRMILGRSPHVVHTFNMLPVNSGPFVISFENELPRYLGPHRDWQHRVGRHLLASKRCKAVLALSDIAGHQASEAMKAIGRTDIANKISVFRGAVLPSTQPDRIPEPNSIGPLRLLFIGRNAIPKGIVPILDAAEKLRRGGIEISLTAIAAISEPGYALSRANIAPERIQARMDNSTWIKHLPGMSNNEVRLQMQQHDLLLFPSLDETLGWITIEAAMEALPTVVTNAYAFPEIVDDGRSGRIIPIELNENHRWTGLSALDQAAAWASTNRVITDYLVRILSEVAEDMSLVTKWGLAARKKILGMYGHEAASQKLKDIYDKALAR